MVSTATLLSSREGCTASAASHGTTAAGPAPRSCRPGGRARRPVGPAPLGTAGGTVRRGAVAAEPARAVPAGATGRCRVPPGQGGGPGQPASRAPRRAGPPSGAGITRGRRRPREKASPGCPISAGEAAFPSAGTLEPGLAGPVRGVTAGCAGDVRAVAACSGWWCGAGRATVCGPMPGRASFGDAAGGPAVRTTACSPGWPDGTAVRCASGPGSARAPPPAVRPSGTPVPSWAAVPRSPLMWHLCGARAARGPSR